MQKKDKEIKSIFEEKKTIGERGIKRFELCDSQALMYMKSTTKHGHILKEAQNALQTANAQNVFSPHKIQYPVKKRFNQDLDETMSEVKSQIT